MEDIREELQMQERFNFWGVFVTPWTKKNRWYLSLYILVLICLILGILYVITGKISFHMIWLFLMPIGFYGVNWIVGRLMDRARKKLPPAPLLQTDCIIINNALQSPCIAHLEPNGLILKPLVGKQVLISLDDIRQIRERRWYNGEGYWGQTIFFEFPSSKQWRLGFGVANAKPWREALNNCVKISTV